RHTIGASSNLATNLLLDLVGVDAARDALRRRGVEGVDLRRGVEDDRAFEAGCNNLVTADGLVQLLRAIRDATGFSAASAHAMLDRPTRPAEHRERLKPGDLLVGRDGQTHRLPRYFYEVDSWERARGIALSPHFELWEFMDVDVREAGILRRFPRYVPCAVNMLASALETLR